MTKSKMANRYLPEVHARAVWMVFEHQGSYETQAGAIAAIAPKIGCIPQTVSGWVKQAEKDCGMRDGVTTEKRDRSEPLKAPLVQAQWRTPSNERTGNCARRTRSCARRQRILRRRNSTAH